MAGLKITPAVPTVAGSNPNIDLNKNPEKALSPKVPTLAKPNMSTVGKKVGVGEAPKSKKDPLKRANQIQDPHQKYTALENIKRMRKGGQWSLNEEVDKLSNKTPISWSDRNRIELKDVPNRSEDERQQELRKLLEKASCRFNENGEAEFLMHKSIDPYNELDIGRGTLRVKGGYTDQWFAEERAARLGASNIGRKVIAAWVPESYLYAPMPLPPPTPPMSVPTMTSDGTLADSNRAYGDRAWIVQHLDRLKIADKEQGYPFMRW